MSGFNIGNVSYPSSAISGVGSTAGLQSSNWVNNWTNTVTLSSGQASALNANDLFTFDLGMSSNVKKYEIYEFTEDVLALSVTWKRIRDSGKNTASKLTDNDLFRNITPEDRIMAETIANYYSKKIMMLKLLDNNKLTNYRKDLNDFIHSDRKKVVESTFGLAYHLPGFYEYDNQLDKIKEDLTIKQDWSKDKNGKQNGKQQSLILTPIKRLHRKTKSMDAYHYWLKSVSGTGVLITLQPSNTLIKLWEHFYNKNEPLVISGTTFCKSLDGFEYLSIKNWEIVHG